MMKIKLTIYAAIKAFLSKAFPNSKYFKYMSLYPELEQWRKEHKEYYPVFKNRYMLYDYLNSEIIKNGQIDYFEFGVYCGDSLKYWVEINTHNKSRFWGFDTFTGLPDTWNLFLGKLKKGAFNGGGKYPVIPDKRVSFVKGLFQDNLSRFLKEQPVSSSLVVNIDSDLYSSALYVLTRCNDILVPGTIIIFDEFSVIWDEFRALKDYCSSYIREYKVLGATRSWSEYYTQVAIQMK